MDIESLRVKLTNHGQQHVIKLWGTLSEEERKLLVDDLETIDLGELAHQFSRCMEDQGHVGEKIDDRLQPVPPEALGSVVRTDDVTLRKYEEEGLRQISETNVAVLLLAGGQGTRLGVNYPKGMYNVGLPSKKSLFQLQAERIIKVQELAGKLTGKPGIVPWYIMTSEHTQEPTKQFFQRHDYFGLNPDNVVFFEQNTLPCLTFEGKIILEKPYKVARAPDGNGGLYRAMAQSKVIEDLANRGVQYVHVYCVDNILVKMADPVFLGFCIQKGACCGAKVVEKSVPTEPVGVVCKVDGLYQVVEYSEVSLKTAERRNQDGRLTFNAGNICNHFFSMEFLRGVISEYEKQLVHHVAKKKIPFVDDQGETVRPTQTNGIKMEKFVFDVFSFAKSAFAVWEVLREDEFSPLKNADDAPKDTPTTSRHAIYNLHMRQVLKAGGAFTGEDGGALPHIPSNGNGNGHTGNGSNHSTSHSEDSDEPIVCEVSPLLSYAGEGLADVVAGKKFVPPLHLKTQGEAGKDASSLAN